MELQIITYKDQRILTTQQLAAAYKTDAKTIIKNYNNNKQRYQEGKHFFLLQGEDLRTFKREVQNLDIAQNTNKLYLWTEKGSLMNAKSLGTDEAWEVYEKLVDEYYRKMQALTTEQKVILSLEYTKEVSGRVDVLGNEFEEFKQDLPLIGDEPDEVRIAVSKLAKDILGCNGKDKSPAYKDKVIRSSVYSDIWTQVKHAFSVHRYKAIKRKYLPEVKEFLDDKYTCPKELLNLIEEKNTEVPCDVD